MKDHSLFRVCAEVDLDIIKSNLESINASLEGSSSVVGVIKADAYGHGALAVADAICNGVSAFAVATPDEALELRDKFGEKPIFILGYSHPDTYPMLINHGIQPAIYRYTDAELLSNAALALGKKAKINIKLDTGMGRIGFTCGKDSLDEVEKISRLSGITLEGIFTHFSVADSSEEGDREFTRVQQEKFNGFICECDKRGIRFKNISCANSAGIIGVNYSAHNLVRAGILLYGYYPSDQVSRHIKVAPALSLKSHVIQIKEVAAGTSIGYGRSFVTEKPMRIATVPVGYGDGYPRLLSGKGRVLICGEYAPIIGRVCMDMFMVDITHIPNASELSEVVLLGAQGEKSIDADELAELTDTISYEIICNIGKRVPRTYKQNN